MVNQKIQGETEQRPIFQRYHQEILQELHRAFAHNASPAQKNGDEAWAQEHPPSTHSPEPPLRPALPAA